MDKNDFTRAREELGFTLHECNDMKTMQMIPYEINKYFKHFGGVGEINLLQRKASKNIWKMFPNWKK